MAPFPARVIAAVVDDRGSTNDVVFWVLLVRISFTVAWVLKTENEAAALGYPIAAQKINPPPQRGIK